MVRILCFGDSITYGECDLINGGWADHLKDDFVALYSNTNRQDVILYNLGIGGETTDGLYSRFEVEFASRSIKGQKTIVILSYGANDIVIHKNRNIVPQEYFIRNLQQCIQIAKRSNASIILSSILPIDDSIDGVINQHDKLRYNKDIEAYNSLLRKIAGENACFYLDIFSKFLLKGKENLLASDGVHPNSKGHKLIYRMVEQILSDKRWALPTKNID